MINMCSPKVSVLTPVYKTNLEHLKECIDSVLNQTFKDFEFILLNDNPNDKEDEELIKLYSDNRIRYYKNEKNLGISLSRNKLLDLAEGEYVAILDHDDVCVPERLEKEVEYLDNHPAIGVVGSFLQFFGNKTDLIKDPEFDLEIKIKMSHEIGMRHTTLMMRKSILDQNQLRYEEYFSPAEDYRLLARLVEFTRFYNFQEPLVRYRVHEENTTNKQFNRMLKRSDEIVLELRNSFPEYYNEYKQRQKRVVNIRLFNLFPLFKIRDEWIFLFNVIPLFKIKWKFEKR